jgi:hypothetical protein
MALPRAGSLLVYFSVHNVSHAALHVRLSILALSLVLTYDCIELIGVGSTIMRLGVTGWVVTLALVAVGGAEEDCVLYVPLPWPHWSSPPASAVTAVLLPNALRGKLTHAMSV